MSGALTAGAIAATASATIALDASTPNQAVSVGDFVFNSWEIPERVNWGGAQRVLVHKLIGGDRTIDIMGPDNGDISWSGIFLGPDAAARADQLDQMRKVGQVYELIFATRHYSVVISNLTFDQRLLAYIPYNLTMCVKRDQSSVPAPYDPGALAAVSADCAAANALLTAENFALNPAAAALAVMPMLLAPLPALVADTAGTEAAMAGMFAAQTALTAADGAAEAQLDIMAAGALQMGTVAAATTVVGAVNNMQAALVASQTAAMAVASGAYLGRAIATASAA